MDIRDYFQMTGRKILLADSVSVGNAIRRKCNIEDGINTADVVTMTVQMIAEELVLAYEAVHAPSKDITLLQGDEAAYYLDDVIAENRPDFIPEESLSIATLKQIYQALSVIRCFEKSEAYANSDETKVFGFKKLISAFENKLEGEALYDMPLVLNKAIDIVRKAEEGNTAYPLDYYLPWLRECVVGDLNTNRRRGMEEKFISLLFGVCAIPMNSVEFLAYDAIDASKGSGMVDWNFFVAYGQINEIRHIADEMIRLTSSGEHSFDQMNVIYTSADYENYIAGIFDYLRIPYAFDGGYHASNTGFVQLMLAVLDFAENGYVFEGLDAIVENQYLTFSGICKDTQKINPNTGYVRTPGENIGWGKERFERYLNREDIVSAIREAENYTYDTEATEEECDENTARERYAILNRGYFAIFLQKLIEIFDDKNNVAVMYGKLLEFVKKYTYARNPDRRDLIGTLEEQKKVFAGISGVRCATVNDRIQYIREYLENLTYSRRSGEVAVSVSRFNGFQVLECPYNFLIGLGAKQFASNNIESAVMSDREMQMYLRGSHLPLASERNVLKQEDFRMMLRSLMAGNIFVGYSNYNTVELRECSPSVIYMELRENSEQSIAGGYELVKEELRIDAGEYREWLDTVISDEERQKYEKSSVIEVTDEASMSASQLQILLECPLRYYYNYVRKLSMPVRREKRGQEWLPAMDRGNLFHRIAENYMSQAMPPARAVSPELDKELFEKVYSEQVKRIEDEVPWYSDVIRKQETEEYKKAAENFLQEMHEQWSNDDRVGRKWQILGCELDFEYEDNLIYVDYGETLESAGDEKESETEETEPKYPYRIHFRKGQIDRLDGYVDEKGCLNLRIIDYKTGKLKNKQAEIEADIQIQHLVYAMAAFEYVRKLRERKVCPDGANIFDAYEEISGVRLVEAAYVFPLEDQGNQVLSAMPYMEKLLAQDEKDPFVWSVEFPDGVRNVLRQTEGYRQNGEVDSIAANIQELLQERASSCDFCDYTEVCRMKCGVAKQDKRDADDTEEMSGQE